MGETDMGRVIPFPAARARRPAAATTGQERLAAALATLEAALAVQRAAMAGFRDSLGALNAAVGTLETGVTGYADRLATLRREVDGVTGTARAIEAWADGVLARAR